jgi:glutaredoxin/glutathione-dependent peroxiredoxin
LEADSSVTIETGQHLPEVNLTVMSAEGPAPVTSSELLGQGRVVLFAVPGPFTPTCSANHLPGFRDHFQALTDKGVDKVVCTAVSDIFVMDAWRKHTGLDDQIVMAADGNGEFSRALGLELDGRAFGMGMRSQRYAMILKDGMVEQLLIDEPGGFRVSSAEYVLDRL